VYVTVCFHIRAEDGTVRGCVESAQQHSGCANITRASEICYCDDDLCNVNRAATEKASSALQWLNPRAYRCPLPFCGAAATGYLPGVADSDFSRRVSELVGRLQVRPVNVQLHLNYCDPKSTIATMIMTIALLIGLKLVLFVFQRLQ